MSPRATSALKLRPFKLPTHLRRTLSNGLEVHLLPRGPLPLVAVRLVVRAGSAFDPPGRFGLADFGARLFRRGAGGQTADELSDAIELAGASMGGFANEENVVVSMSTPARHLEAMLDVFARLVMAPDFPEAEVELARRRTLAMLANELDDPGSLADRALIRAVWGEHPYGHEASGGRADVERFTLAELKSFHAQRLGPSLAQLYLVGDLEPDRVLASLERSLGTWRGGPSSAPSVPEWRGLEQPGQVVVVDKPEQTQAQVRVGARGVRRGHPDHFPLIVMNTVLGGGFTSRLVTEIRVKRGLSYGAGSSFEMLGAAGSFSISSFTRTETVDTLLEVTLAEVSKMRQRGPSARELATVQRYISGLYPSRLETNEAIAGAIADVVNYGLDDEWLSAYRERVVAVSAREAAHAARTHLFDRDRVITVVGNAEAMKPKLERFGPLTVIKPSELE
jgi:zinc protease